MYVFIPVSVHTNLTSGLPSPRLQSTQTLCQKEEEEEEEEKELCAPICVLLILYLEKTPK
jgi:hypothetical protein